MLTLPLTLKTLEVLLKRTHSSSMACLATKGKEFSSSSCSSSCSSALYCASLAVVVKDALEATPKVNQSAGAE